MNLPEGKKSNKIVSAIALFLDRYVLCYLLDPVYKIKKIIDYIPLLWNDYDFSWENILILTRYKIKRTREHIVKHNLHMGCETDAKDMLETEAIITRIVEDDYFREEYHKWHDKYPMRTKELKDGTMRMRNNSAKANKWFMSIMKKHHESQKKDWNRLCWLLKNRMQRWWD
jgi:hypothetical protein